MKRLSWNNLRRWASRKPTTLLLRPRSRALRLEILDVRRMLSGLSPMLGSPAPDNPASDIGSNTSDIDATVAYDTAAAGNYGSVNLTSVGINNDVIVTADIAGQAGSDIDIIYSSNPGGTLEATVTFNADASSSIKVELATTAWVVESATDITMGGAGGQVSITADAAGDQYNGLQLTIVNGGADSATYDHANKTITAIVTTPGATAATDVAAAINYDLGHLFTAAVGTTNSAVSAGTYDFAADSASNTLGSNGGIITSTANNVIGELNTDADTFALVTATAGEVSTTGVVTALTDRAYHGTVNTGSASDTNNYLQFLGPDGSSDLNFRFVANGASQPLSIDLVSNPDTAGYATGVAQSNAGNASFHVTADNTGEVYSDVSIALTDDSNVAAPAGSTDPAVVAWDPENKTITFTGDFDAAAFTANELINIINNDTVTGPLFTAAVFGYGNGAGLVDVPAVGGSLIMGTMTGGNQYTGVTVNLSTDASGVITTTAADLVTWVDAGGTTLDTLGISVSHVGTSTGAGLLTAGPMAFGSENTISTTGFATTTTANASGVNSQAVITAKTSGADYDNIRVNFHHDYAVTGGFDEYVTYSAITRELNIYIETGISTLNNVIARLGDAASSAADALFSIQAVAGGTGAGMLNSSDIGGTTSGGLVVDTSIQTGVHLVFEDDVNGLPGDASGDGTVNEADKAIVSANWQMQSGATWGDGDFNADGRVDDLDATIMAANWGLTLLTATSSLAVTEPEVSYDLDNDGQIGLGDLAFFAAVYRQQPGITTESPHAYAADFDRSGTVDLGDLAFFAANYRLGRTNDSIAYPAAPMAALTVAAAPASLSGDDRVNDADATVLAQYWLISIEDLDKEDDTHRAVFAAVGASGDLLGLLDE